MQPSALCSTFRLEDSNEPNTQTQKVRLTTNQW